MPRSRFQAGLRPGVRQEEGHPDTAGIRMPVWVALQGMAVERNNRRESVMKVGRIIAAIFKVVVPIMLAQAAVAHAGEIRVLSTSGMRSVVEELAPQFERTTGHTLHLTFGTTGALQSQIEAGVPCDVALLGAPFIDALITQGRLRADTRTDVARSGIGIAVRAGAPKPDIRTVEALKRTLLAASSIAYNKDATSGIYFMSLLERLGIADAVQPKTTSGTGFVAALVAKGEAEMAVQASSDHLAVPGVELVGPLPAEVQHYVVFTAGIGAAVTDLRLAKELITFLTAPSAVPVLTAKGLEPVLSP
jgi:molybdate transport system substrate-binding protein